MPINNISRLLKELAMAIPQRTKKISAKYSPGLLPIAAMSCPFSRKISQCAAKNDAVEKQTEQRQNRACYGYRSGKNDTRSYPVQSLPARGLLSPGSPIAAMEEFFFRKIPLNIMITPKTADVMIEFICLLGSSFRV